VTTRISLQEAQTKLPELIHDLHEGRRWSSPSTTSRGPPPSRRWRGSAKATAAGNTTRHGVVHGPGLRRAAR